MQRASLMPPTAMKATQVKEAKDMEQAVQDRADRIGAEAPQFEFLELIGKGAFGRVFKCKELKKNRLVAVKTIDVNKEEYEFEVKALGRQAGMTPKQARTRALENLKERGLNELRREVDLMKQLEKSGAQYVNIIHEAFEFAGQLWLVSDYCSGGSVRTLMRAAPHGLDEKYIIPIARELAIALKCVHDVGVIHRDLKCANILIGEDGNIQLCDFGIASMLENEVAKRQTIIGTPHWSPPEMVREMANPTQASFQYGKELDVWGFGSTVYEMATGHPPYAERTDVRRLRIALRSAPRLEGEEYSENLREFITFCLETDPTKRPTADAVQRHPYIANTEKRYPASALVQLMERYVQWEVMGGQRQSMLPQYGAVGPQDMDSFMSQEDDWRFSIAGGDFVFPAIAPPTSTAARRGRSPTPLDIGANAQPGMQAGRSASQQSGRNDQAGGSSRLSDLPLRNLANNRPASHQSVVIDLDDALPRPVARDIDLNNVPTLRAKRSKGFMGTVDEDDREEVRTATQVSDPRRGTMEWSFASAAAEIAPKTAGAAPSAKNRGTMDWTFASAVTETKPPKTAQPRERKRDTMGWTWENAGYTSDPEETVKATETTFPIAPATAGLLQRPPLKHTVTEPLGSAGDFLHTSRSASPNRHSLIDLDLDPMEINRPSTANSNADSTYSTSTTGGDPFAFEDRLYGVDNAPPATAHFIPDSERLSVHAKSRSEPTLAVEPADTPNEELRNLPGTGLADRASRLGFSVDDTRRRRLESEDPMTRRIAAVDDDRGEAELTLKPGRDGSTAAPGAVRAMRPPVAQGLTGLRFAGGDGDDDEDQAELQFRREEEGRMTDEALSGIAAELMAASELMLRTLKDLMPDIGGVR